MNPKFTAPAFWGVGPPLHHIIALPIEAFPGTITQKHDPPLLLLGLTTPAKMMEMTRRNATEVTDAFEAEAAEDERLSALGEDLLRVHESFRDCLA